MESEIDPKDLCFCLVPWVKLHKIIILPNASQSAPPRQRRIITDIAEFKLKYEKEKGPQFWKSHCDTCPNRNRVTCLKNLQTSKQKPEFEGVIGANMIPLIKDPPKSTTESEKKKLNTLQNSKGVVRAAFKLFLSKRTPGEKISLKSFKDMYKLPFDERIIDEDLKAVLGEDCFAEYFPLEGSEMETEIDSPEEIPSLTDQIENVHLEDTVEEMDFPAPSPIEMPPTIMCFPSSPVVEDVIYSESFILAGMEEFTSELESSDEDSIFGSESNDKMTLTGKKLVKEKVIFDDSPASNDEPILNDIAYLDDSDIVESIRESSPTVESFGNTDAGDVINFPEELGRMPGCFTLTQKPTPAIPKRIIYGPDTEVFHLMNKVVAELFEPEEEPDGVDSQLDWSNYFE